MSGSRFAWTTVGVLAMTCLSAGQAHARMMFGTEEKIRVIQPTKDPQFNLCHKVRTYFFLAGCYVKDDGYVLQKVGDSGNYFSLTPDQIQQLQTTGDLPTPLPAYSLSIFDYLFGYSNWIILAIFVGIPLVKGAWDAMRSKPAEAPPPSVPNADTPVAPPDAGPG